MEICKKFIENNPLTFVHNMGNFEVNFLNKPNYTPEYRLKLDKIKKERNMNLGEKENFWNIVLDFDNLELKPNIAGIRININELVNKFRKH